MSRYWLDTMISECSSSRSGGHNDAKYDTGQTAPRRRHFISAERLTKHVRLPFVIQSLAAAASVAERPAGCSTPHPLVTCPLPVVIQCLGLV